jgi:hypothetical protein
MALAELPAVAITFGLTSGSVLARKSVMKTIRRSRFTNRKKPKSSLRIAPVIGLFFPLLRKHGKQLISSLQHHHGGLAYWLRSLLDAIHDCRDKANALDGRRGTGTIFNWRCVAYVV